MIDLIPLDEAMNAQKMKESHDINRYGYGYGGWHRVFVILHPGGWREMLNYPEYLERYKVEASKPGEAVND